MDDKQTDGAACAFADAVNNAGGQSAFERLSGMRQQTISYRLKRRLPLPAEFVLKVEAETGVSRHLLRPDIYPAGPSAPLSDSSVSPGGPIVACDRPAFSQRGAA